MQLKDFFIADPSFALAFSGGVDSSYLLYEAVKCGADVKAYYIKTAFQPSFELRDARNIASLIGARLAVVELDVLDNPHIVENTPDRCYYCKRGIIAAIAQKAAPDGYKLIIDGTNASDDAQDRAGMRALADMAVRSPLRECGYTKDKIRELSKAAGLPTWDKPAYACLATRIPAGRAITAQLLSKIEQAEEILFSMGYSDFRVRIAGDAAKLQFTSAQLADAFDKREEIVIKLKQLFASVLLDLEHRI